MKKAQTLIPVLLFVSAIIFFSFQTKDQTPQVQKYSLTLSMQEWQAVVGAITSPDDYSNNAKKQVAELIQKNLVAVDTTKKK